MRRGLSRRTLLETIAAGSVVGLAGCGGRTSDTAAAVGGTVTDLQEDTLPDATVATLGHAGEVVAETGVDDQGRFEVSTDRARWLRVDHPEHVPRVRAVAPGAELPVRLTPDTDGLVSLAFGGDVMFGRRFYESGGDGLSERARIDPGSRAQSHREILGYVAPLLEHADITSVNLETPLTTTDWRYPDKTFQFTSHPSAAGALADAGVDYAALGNNHVFDALTPGLDDTRDALTEAEIGFSGAGATSAAAWAPATVTRGDTTVAYLSCTTVVGGQYRIDWAAGGPDSGTYTVEQGGRRLSVSGAAGVAAASEDRLRTEVRNARDRADVVVVQIHGGDEYRHRPTETMGRLTDAAAGAGADLVVNHHPHVTGGLEHRDGSLVAWSLGNLVFDQVLWETLRSYVLVVHADADGIRRVMAEPLLLDGYVPKGVAGDVRQKLSGDTAALSTGALGGGVAGTSGRIGASGGTSVRTRTVDADGQRFRRTAPGVTTVTDHSGRVELGRDRLYTGAFEETLVDGERYTAPLWRFRRRPSATGETAGRDGGGVRITSFGENTRRSLLSLFSRVPAEGGSYTLFGWYRSRAEFSVELLVPWYSAASGGSFERERVTLPPTGGEWERIDESFDPPADAAFVNLFVFLAPPDDRDTHDISFDDVRLVEWTTPSNAAGRYHDYLYVDGTATVRIESDPDVAGRVWSPV